MFESEFLNRSEGSKNAYRRLVSQVAEILCSSLPDLPYCGKDAASLANLVSSDILPATACSSEQLANTLRTIAENSVAVGDPHTIAHLHCPPLLAALALHADYLNPELHEDESVPNLVTTSLLTSRRFDALKLWISFQSLGRTKLAAMIDRTIELAEHAARIVGETRPLELVCEPQLSTVVFRYVPTHARIDVDRLNATLRQRMFDKGLAVIGHTRVRNQQCLKFTCVNPATTEGQMENLIAKIVDQGRELESLC